MTGLGPPDQKTYQVQNKVLNQALELRHGKFEKFWTMDKVSNSALLPVRRCDILSREVKLTMSVLGGVFEVHC